MKYLFTKYDINESLCYYKMCELINSRNRWLLNEKVYPNLAQIYNSKQNKLGSRVLSFFRMLTTQPRY